MNRIKRKLLAYVLRRTTASIGPSELSSDDKDIQQRNFFYPWILKDGERDVVALQVIGDELHGRRYNDDRSFAEVRLPLTQIDPDSIEVTHHYGGDEVRYEGVWSVVIGLWTRWPYLYIHARRLWDAIAQRLLNQRSLISRRRLDVLREVITLATKTNKYIEPTDLLSARHGDRWAAHPYWWGALAELEELFQFLEDTGDLQKGMKGYRPTGQGLRTLEEAEEADRRHKESIRVQLLLAILALASAVLAAAQAGLIRFPVLLDLTSANTNCYLYYA